MFVVRTYFRCVHILWFSALFNLILYYIAHTQKKNTLLKQMQSLNVLNIRIVCKDAVKWVGGWLVGERIFGINENACALTGRALARH